MSVKLKTNLVHRYGRVQILPIIGETQISKDGIIEVETLEQANSLVKCEIGFSFLEDDGKDDEIKPQIEKSEPLEVGKSKEKDEDALKPQVEESQPLNTSESTETEVFLENIEKNEESISTSEVKKTEEDELKAKENLPTQEEVLNGMKVVELQAMADPFPKTEWQGLKKADLVKYLLVKLEETK